MPAKTEFYALNMDNLGAAPTHVLKKFIASFDRDDQGMPPAFKAAMAKAIREVKAELSRRAETSEEQQALAE